MTFKDFINFIIYTLVEPFFSIFLGVAVVLFLWNIMGIIRKSGQPEELATMKTQATWSIVAIAVMVSMWGLVNFVTGSLKLNTTGSINLDRFEQPL